MAAVQDFDTYLEFIPDTERTCLTRGAGRGVRARANIDEGDLVANYVGPAYTPEDFERLIQIWPELSAQRQVYEFQCCSYYFVFFSAT